MFVSRLRLKAMLLMILVLADESVRVARAIEFTSREEGRFERTRRYVTRFRRGEKTNSEQKMSGDVPQNAVLLSLETKTGSEAKCFGVCTGIAIAIAITAGVAAGVTVAVLVSAKSSLLKLEAVLKDIMASKSSSCVIIRQIAFQTKSFQIATRAFANSVKIVVPPPRSSSEDNVAQREFLEKLELDAETDTRGNAVKLQNYLESML